MIISYNWQIIDKIPQNQNQLIKLIKIPTREDQEIFSPQSPSNTIQPMTLHFPHFGFLFCYVIQQPKINPPELEIFPELTMIEEPISMRVIQQIRRKNCILLELSIDNSEIHDILMALTMRIRYHTGSKPSKIGNVENLVRLAGNRQLNLYSATTYATLRKQIIIESPITIEHRYQKQGYLIIKIIRNQDANQQVQINKVEIMNWLTKGNKEIKRQVVIGLLNQPFILCGKESYSLPFKIENSLTGAEIPVAITYNFPPHKQLFKMIRIIKGNTSD